MSMRKISAGRRGRRAGTRKTLPVIHVYPIGETEYYYLSKIKAETRGLGFTLRVVNGAIGLSEDEIVALAIKHIESKAIEPEDEVYLVFDYDASLVDRGSREKVIKKVYDEIERFNRDTQNSPKISIVLSNDSFELWYVLHFQDITGVINRSVLEKILSDKLKRKYKKPEPKMYDFLNSCGSREEATKRARALSERHAHQNPSTDVYKLVERLTHPKTSKTT